jgi:MSHA biogenesis protein MshK
MAQFMKLRTHHYLIALSSVSVMALTNTQLTHAQSLKDPTRPPSMTVQGEQLLELGPQLQSVLISDKQRVAMINGEPVKINGRVGDQTVVKIEENFVVLKRGRNLTTLKLYPEIQKKPANALSSSVRHSNTNSTLNSNREVKQTSQEGKQK